MLFLSSFSSSCQSSIQIQNCFIITVLNGVINGVFPVWIHDGLFVSRHVELQPQGIPDKTINFSPVPSDIVRLHLHSPDCQRVIFASRIASTTKAEFDT